MRTLRMICLAQVVQATGQQPASQLCSSRGGRLISPYSLVEESHRTLTVSFA